MCSASPTTRWPGARRATSTTSPAPRLPRFTGGSLLAVSLTWGLGHAAAAGFQNQQLMSVWYFGNVRGLRVMLAMAAGALLGDLIESIIKRKRGLARGARWWPWDQLDAVIGGFMAVLIVDHQWFFQNLIPGRGLLVAIWIGIYLAVHPLFSWSAYALKLKANPH